MTLVAGIPPDVDLALSIRDRSGAVERKPVEAQ
jgi:hypothetical protein